MFSSVGLIWCYLTLCRLFFKSSLSLVKRASVLHIVECANCTFVCNCAVYRVLLFVMTCFVIYCLYQVLFCFFVRWILCLNLHCNCVDNCFFVFMYNHCWPQCKFLLPVYASLCMCIKSISTCAELVVCIVDISTCSLWLRTSDKATPLERILFCLQGQHWDLHKTDEKFCGSTPAKYA